MRMIVPDTSVMVPAFFPERLVVGGNEFDLSARARPLTNAIRLRGVDAFAPDVLIAEFLNTVAAKAFDRTGGGTIDPQGARDQVLDFLAGGSRGRGRGRKFFRGRHQPGSVADLALQPRSGGCVQD